MSTEEKKLTSSEIDEMLKEMEEYHQPIRTKNNNRKKRPKIRIDMIIAGVVILALVVGAVALIFHFTQKSSHSTSKSVKENPRQKLRQLRSFWGQIMKSLHQMVMLEIFQRVQWE